MRNPNPQRGFQKNKAGDGQWSVCCRDVGENNIRTVGRHCIFLIICGLMMVGMLIPQICLLNHFWQDRLSQSQYSNPSKMPRSGYIISVACDGSGW